jgi:hypothetical protein
MSDYLAVGGVSAVLRSLLTSALTNGGPGTILGAATPGITATSPDLIPTGQDEQPRLNIFMYYASYNAALRNLGLPSMDSQHNRLSNPPLALNLHYLVSAYGSNQFDPEILLAWAMMVFHETPVVPRQTIQDALSNLITSNNTPETQLISGSTLANQIEHIRITPETLSTEEIYRLWTAFQTNYRPTTSYQVSVVVIQETQTFKSNLPVQKRTVTALPLQAPVIDHVAPSIVALDQGTPLVITGSNFLGDSAAETLVVFDAGAPVSPDSVQGTSVRVTLPTTLPAGTRSVRVQRTIRFGIPTDPHRGFTSGPVPFQLVPTIQNVPPVQVQRGATLTLTLSPAVGRAQQAVLFIGDSAITIDERPVSDPATSPTLDFPIPADFSTGTFPLRVEIDGAQSRLTLDSVRGSPTFGQFLPQVQVTP